MFLRKLFDLVVQPCYILSVSLIRLTLKYWSLALRVNILSVFFRFGSDLEAAPYEIWQHVPGVFSVLHGMAWYEKVIAWNMAFNRHYNKIHLIVWDEISRRTDRRISREGQQPLAITCSIFTTIVKICHCPQVHGWIWNASTTSKGSYSWTGNYKLQYISAGIHFNWQSVWLFETWVNDVLWRLHAYFFRS